MAGNIVSQVFPREATSLVSYVVDEVVGGVLAPLHAQVHIDGGQAHGYGAAAFNGGLLNQHYAHTLQLGPVGCLVGCATASHATADDKYVALDDFGPVVRHCYTAL